MKRITPVVLSLLLVGCSHKSGQGNAPRADRAGRDDGDKARYVSGSDAPKPAATAPSAVQRVVTDAKVLESTKLAVAKGGPAVGKRDEKLKAVALFYGPLPTGLSVSKEGRMFVNFPRWGRPTNYTVAEVADGQLKPFPDAETNRFMPDQPQMADPKTHLVSVQSVVFDAQDRLWLLDTGSINMGPIVDRMAPKMWGYDLKSGRRVKEITFGETAKQKTYLNDVRFDLKRGAEGTAYITDSGAGGIIVVDLASGQSWRKLDGHPSVMADPKLTMMVEGQPMTKKPTPYANAVPPMINSDGIALSPDGRTLYYTPLTGHSVYAVSTDYLADRNVAGPAEADKAVRKVADKASGNDGLICDALGRVYSSDFEENCIRRFTPPVSVDKPSNNSQIVVQDERILWPDTFAMRGDVLYFTANQLNRQPDYHGGQDLLEEPFVIFSYPIEGGR